MLNELAKEAFETAKAHGWHDGDRSFGEIVSLCHSELSEALEAARSGLPMAYYDVSTEQEDVRVIGIDDSGVQKMEGVAVELADCIIRILDYCGEHCIDIDRIMRAKMKYNKTRPYKHGKLF